MNLRFLNDKFKEEKINIWYVEISTPDLSSIRSNIRHQRSRMRIGSLLPDFSDLQQV